MRIHLGVVILLAASILDSRSAHADVFAFKDLDGYEKCMQLDHLIEKVNTPKGAQTRVLGAAEIRLRCIESAVKLLSASKSTDQILGFVKATKRLTAPENSLDLVSVLIDASLPACNELAAYEVLTKALSYPSDNAHYLPKARGIVKRCLKDKDFSKDFLEEPSNGDPNISSNACQILLEEKRVKSCKSK